LENNFVSLGSRITNFKQYLQVDIENDEELYKGVVSTFFAKVSSVSELQRKEEDMPAPIRIKKLKSCWIKRVKCLREMLVDCDNISAKKGDLYLKLIELDLVGSTGDVENSHLILDSMFMSKEQFEEKVELLKTASTKRFNNLTEYSKLEVESWLVSYVKKMNIFKIHYTNFQLTLEI
jgi:hypothetical protein